MLSTSESSESSSTMVRKWARRCERSCCLCATYFPLVFVYGITTWAVWVEASIGFSPTKSRFVGSGTSFLGIILYALLNWSYTTAVFTDPGSPVATNSGYSSLPTNAPPSATSFTVKASGELRYCKKCQTRKPDRTHHCSTCKRCVLKMDHHCPWLATCVGLRNYKPFLLFLIYTTLFCFLCFGVTGNWVWNEIIKDNQYEETLMPINYVMLAVISIIIGIVLAAFTGWHLSLACRNQTTIECLEKTRYLSPLRKAMQHQHIVQHRGQGNGTPSYGQQLRDIHTNALPGVTRPEEGEVNLAAVDADNQGIHQSYDVLERMRARQRYEEYLDELDSEKLPNAFDLGWRRNLRHLFGDKPLLWFFPICNSTWDGWTWEPSEKWIAARDRVRLEREEQRHREGAAGWGEEHLQAPAARDQGAGRHYLASPVPTSGHRSPSKADRVLGRDPSQFADADPRQYDALSLRSLKPQDDESYDDNGDEYEAHHRDINGVGAWGASRLGGSASRLLGKGQAPKNSDWSRDADNDDGVD